MLYFRLCELNLGKTKLCTREQGPIYNEVPGSSTHCKSLAQLRDAEDCYHVILLYSSFLKYLPFHTWYYSHAFNFIVYLDPR